MTILVIDGQGGKLGKSLIESLKKTFPQVEIMAVGTNSTASEAMRRAGGKENNTFFMVGDRSFDMIGAKNCGVPGIGVYFGFAEPGELEEAGADYTVETTEELKTLLMKLVTEAEN